ncbi:hypothetical protein ACIBG7_09340 [Nonomuraea sp. NPDC050328]|uniref:hypothetical protein n=1 Tax=Nonomuraea sp. NPDC050328 TaxID=3364361 RepID=UPI0037B40D01
MTEPPTNPYRMPPGQPYTQPVRTGRPWILPVVAAAVVVLLGAGVGGYLYFGRTSAAGALPKVTEIKPTVSSAASAGPAKPAAPQVCSMLPKEEVDRLVPEAKVLPYSRDNGYAGIFKCSWENHRISYGEWWRQREIEVTISQYKAEGADTGRALAQRSYDLDYTQARFRATSKPKLDPDEREKISEVKDIPGVGEGAYAQYTWRRSGTTTWYSYGEAWTRLGDMVVEVKYDASQQRKDAQILSNETTQSITEENALREVTLLVTQVAKSVADWQARNPGVVAEASPTPTSTAPPSPVPTPTFTTLAAMPPPCQAADQAATALVPGPMKRTRQTAQGNDTQTECRWLNLELPGGEGRKKIRSVLITLHTFTNRAGQADPTSAKGLYTQKFGSAKLMQDFEPGDISWGPPVELKGYGEAAFLQYVADRKNEVFNGGTSLWIRQGEVVVEVSYAGADLPVGEKTNGSKVKLMTRQETGEGAKQVARAVADALTGGSATGS